MKTEGDGRAVGQRWWRAGPVGSRPHAEGGFQNQRDRPGRVTGLSEPPFSGKPPTIGPEV